MGITLIISQRRCRQFLRRRASLDVRILTNDRMQKDYHIISSRAQGHSTQRTRSNLNNHCTIEHRVLTTISLWYTESTISRAVTWWICQPRRQTQRNKSFNLTHCARILQCQDLPTVSPINTNTKTVATSISCLTTVRKSKFPKWFKTSSLTCTQSHFQKFRAGIWAAALTL